MVISRALNLNFKNMIDFIKIYTSQKEALEYKLKTKYDDTICSLNYLTNEVKYPFRKYLENMEVKVTNTSGNIRNSLHKFHNLANYKLDNNYTDFYIEDIFGALNMLSYELGENIDDYKVTNLEFGLNIRTSLPAEEILKNNFAMFNFDNYSQIETFKGKGFYKQYNRREYHIKYYDKAKESKPTLHYNLLRAEIKIVDSKLLKKIGIYTVKDITNPNSLKSLFTFLLDRVEETNIIDNLNDKDIPLEDKHIIELGKSPSYWLELKQNKSNSSYYERRDKYNSILSKYNLLTIKEEVKSLLTQKFNELYYPPYYFETG